MSRQKKVWLEKNELETIYRNMPRLKDKVIVQLGAEMGLRVSEIAKAKVGNIREYTNENDNDINQFLYIESKRTDQESSGNQLKKEREVLIPKRVYSNITMLINEKNLKDNSPLIPNRVGNHYSADGLRQRIYKLMDIVHAETNNDKLLDVSSHDFRRYYAHRNLVVLGKNPRVVMNQGGWKNFECIEPYLSEPSKKVVVDEMG